ncbi:hypothetical protein GCM10010170_065310 [Dactylosporangium salmoneum]|uniref:Uncharacterized protein n=1 Tax=Dactylosporangium salmoneum TaxID=53361 RepID=A0ABN3H0W9_9ACTN
MTVRPPESEVVVSQTLTLSFAALANDCGSTTAAAAATATAARMVACRALDLVLGMGDPLSGAVRPGAAGGRRVAVVIG